MTPTKSAIKTMVFNMDPQRIDEMKQFIGESFGSVGIDKVPNAQPWMSIKNRNDRNEWFVTHFASEGDTIIKHDNGFVSIIKV